MKTCILVLLISAYVCLGQSFLIGDPAFIGQQVTVSTGTTTLDPNQVTSAELLIWYRVSDTNSSNGTIITNLYDRSGNASTAIATTGNYWTNTSLFNNQPALFFSGSRGFNLPISAVKIWSATNITAMFVICPFNTTDSDRRLIDVAEDRLILNSNSGGTASKVGIYQGSFIDIADGSTTAQVLSFVLVTGTSQAKLYRNGSQIGANFTYTASAHNGSTIGVCDGYTPTGAPYHGWMAEWAIYLGTVSESERVKVERKWGTTYGITTP